MLMEAMTKIDSSSYVEVEWRSIRSDERQSASGIVTKVICHQDGTRQIRFRRDDGQLMIIKEDYNIYSAGSHHPLTGSITNIKVL